MPEAMPPEQINVRVLDVINFVERGTTSVGAIKKQCYGSLLSYLRTCQG
jgi:hypothetical protein